MCEGGCLEQRYTARGSPEKIMTGAGNNESRESVFDLGVSTLALKGDHRDLLAPSRSPAALEVTIAALPTAHFRKRSPGRRKFPNA